MKILMFTESLRAGGKERRLVELLKCLSNYKHIKCNLALMSKEIHYQDVHNLNIKIHYLIRKFRKDPGIFIKLYKICKDFKPDLIHSWGPMPSVYSFPIAKILKIKFINGMITHAPHKLKIFREDWIRSKLTFPFSDAIVSNSYAGLRTFNIYNNKKAYFIHNGFDFSRLQNITDKKEIKERYHIQTERVVGMVASFTEYKDYETFLYAAERVLERLYNVTFIAVGDGKNLEKCKKLVKPQQKNKILFLGKQDDIESIINVFDVGVLLTNQKILEEGISNSVMEYMASGKPVIATDGGGTREILIDGKTGFLVKAFQIDELSEKIIYLLKHNETARKMGEAGRERIMKNFNLNNMVNSYTKLYKNLLK